MTNFIFCAVIEKPRNRKEYKEKWTNHVIRLNSDRDKRRMDLLPTNTQMLGTTGIFLTDGVQSGTDQPVTLRDIEREWPEAKRVGGLLIFIEVRFRKGKGEKGNGRPFLVLPLEICQKLISANLKTKISNSFSASASLQVKWNTVWPFVCGCFSS